MPLGVASGGIYSGAYGGSGPPAYTQEAPNYGGTQGYDNSGNTVVPSSGNSWWEQLVSSIPGSSSYSIPMGETSTAWDPNVTWWERVINTLPSDLQDTIRNVWENQGTEIGNAQAAAVNAEFQRLMTSQGYPQLLASERQDNLWTSNIGALSGYQSAQSGLLNDAYQNQLASIGLSQQGIGIQQENVGINQESIGIQQTGNLRTVDYIAHLQDIAGQLLGVNTTDVTQRADTAERGVLSDSTARGAMHAPGTGLAITDINNAETNQLSTLNLGYERDSAGFAEQTAGLHEQNALLDNQHDLLDNEREMLELRAQQLGLDADGLYTNLQMGLQRLGLDTTLSVNDLLGRLNSSDIQDQMLVQQLWNAALTASDQYQNYMGAGAGQSPNQQPTRPVTGAY